MGLKMQQVTGRRSASRRGLRRVALCLCAALALPLIARAQETAEVRAFSAAREAYALGAFERAEREFGQFVAVHPQSPMLAEAVLLQARSAMKLGRLPVAVSLLNSSLTKAGPLADQFRYRIGEAHLLASNYLAAAESFAALARDFTNSLLLLEASHDEAQARFKVRDFSRVVALLREPEGAFQRAARTRPNDALAVRGRLLLGEALLAQGRHDEAAGAAAAIVEDELAPDFKWDRQYLLCRIQLADHRFTDALAGASNLVTLALGTARGELQADAFALQAAVYQSLNQPDAALQAYTNNLAGSVPPDRRRAALLQIIHLNLSRERIADAAQQLESFVVRHPEDAAMDALLLALGQLHLKLHLDNAATNGANAIVPSPVSPPGPTPPTNHLTLALARLDRLLTAFTNSPLRGKAFLGKGWCLWLDGRTNDSTAAFRAAVEWLPASEDAAVARFKLGDALLASGDFTNALASYQAVAETAAVLPQVRDELLPQARYQMVRAALGAGDAAAAERALAELLANQPDHLLAERSLLLAGQAFNDFGIPARARGLLTDFSQRFPASPLLPRAQIVLAHTHADEGDWPGAARQYERWLARFETNALRSQAEFGLAWATAKAGQETNALALFNNFIARFPTDELARQAQLWVGGHHLRAGDFVTAQKVFQSAAESTNWPVSRLTYLARLDAGRAAFRRQGWRDAGGRKGHFTLLVNDVANCPPDIAAEAMFALGDTYILGDTNAFDPEDAGRPFARYAEAKNTFEKILQLAATNELVRPLVPAALGRIGDCSLQLARDDPRQYADATNAYTRVLTNATASSAMRSMAEFGLGQTLELMARNGAAADATNLLTAAFDHYLNVVIGASVAGEADPFWIKQTGYAAAKLAEERQQWDIAANVYERMAVSLPILRPRLQDRIDKARERARAELR